MPDRENANDIQQRLVAIQRHIATLTVADHQFPIRVLTRTTDSRMARKDVDRIRNREHRNFCRIGSFFGEKRFQAIEIRERPAGIDYFRHLMGFGRGALFPRARART